MIPKATVTIPNAFQIACGDLIKIPETYVKVEFGCVIEGIVCGESMTIYDEGGHSDEQAAFIAKAVNSHKKLVKAVQAFLDFDEGEPALNIENYHEYNTALELSQTIMKELNDEQKQ